MHDRCKLHSVDLYREMEVVSHETIGEYVRIRLPFNAIKCAQEGAPILGIDEDVSSVDASGHHMIDRAGIMYSWSSSHTIIRLTP